MESTGGDAPGLHPGRDVLPQGGALGARASGDGDPAGLVQAILAHFIR